MKLIKWMAGFFEDQTDSASSKRLVLYIFVFIFWMEVKANIAGIKVDPQILYATIGVILFCIGAVTAEFFKKDDSTTSSTKTTSIETENKTAL
jgi:hypothetical protein